MNKKNFLFLSITAIIYTIFAFFSAEKIPVNHNLGWDGAGYWKIASDFKHRLQNDSINKYHVQRIFPSVITHYSLKTIDKIGRYLGREPLAPTAFAVVNSFLVLNGIFILLSVFFLLKISEFLGFSSQQQILLFVGIFGNFCFLKFPFYMPVMTDTTAFMLATALLYFYLKDNRTGFLITTFVGAFTFPTLTYYALILYIFPHQNPISESSKNKILNLISIGIAIVGILYLAYFQLHTQNYLEIVLVITYVIFVLLKYFDFIRFWTYARQIKFKRLTEIILLLVFISLLQRFMANDEAYVTFWGVISRIIETASKFPLVFLPAHFMYFGVILFLLVFFWEKSYQFVKKMGNGFEMLMVLIFFLALGSESRIHITALPFLMVVVVSAVEKIENKLFFYSLMVIQIVLSKFWYPISDSNMGNGNAQMEEFEKFPWQNYFMNFGPWVSETMHYVHLGIVVLVLGYLYLVKKYA